MDSTVATFCVSIPRGSTVRLQGDSAGGIRENMPEYLTIRRESIEQISSDRLVPSKHTLSPHGFPRCERVSRASSQVFFPASLRFPVSTFLDDQLFQNR